MKLSLAVETFLDSHIPTTRRSYKYVLYDMVEYLGASKLVSEVIPIDVERYISNVKQRDAIGSNATINKYIATVKTFFNWAVKFELIEKSPAKAIKRLRKSLKVSREKAMPEHKYKQLLDYLRLQAAASASREDNGPIRDLALVLFIGDTGCRIGGAATLVMENLRIHEKSAIVIEKGQPPRPVFFGDPARHALRQWLQCRIGGAGQYVFQRRGKRVTNRSLSQHFRRLCKKAKIGSWGPHSLRHRKGHQLADNRAAPSVAAKLLGHSNPTTTLQHYYPDDWDRVRREAEKLAEQPAPTNIKRFGQSG